MSILMMAAASALVAPVHNPMKHVGIPREGKGDWSAAVVALVLIDPSGRAIRCDVIQKHGNELLADKLCPVDIAGGFKPARTQDGSATYGVIYQLIAQVGTDSPKWKEFVQMGQPYSLAVSDDEVGLAVKKPTEIELVVAVDQSGGISHCQPGKIAGKLESAANMACAAVKRQVVKMPFAIPQGGFVMNYRVLIVHQKPKN